MKLDELPFRAAIRFAASRSVMTAADEQMIYTEIANLEVQRERWAMIDRLRDAEGHSVEIIHDNADFGGPNCAVRTTTDYGEDYTTFYGETVDDCLAQALAAKGDSRG